MSITSSNNLALNNSLTVNGNSIFGVDNTSTIICNSKPTFNSDVTISGNINQTSGTFSTGSGNVNLNGDVIISSNKKLTTGTGDTTINGLLKCNGTINNVGLLASSGSFELGPTTGTDFTYIDIRTTGGNYDFDSRIGVTGGSSSNFGRGALSFNCASCAIEAPLTVNGITNNNTLTQTGTIACNAINCTSINNSGSFNAINCTSINNSGILAQTGTITCNAINCTSINNSGTLAQTGTITCNAINSTSINNSGTLAQTGTITCNAINSTSINNSGPLAQTGTITCNAINSTSINNSGTLAQTGTITCNGITNNNTLDQNALANFSNLVKVNSGQSVYITDALLTNYLRMHHSGAAAYFDSTGGLNFRNGTTDNFNINGSTNQASFNYNLNTNGITNNAALYQNSTATFSNAITAPSISTTSSSFYASSGNNYDTAAISAPKVINGIATGTADGAPYTQFNLAINSWQGVGFVYSNPAGPSVCKLVIDTRTGNLNTIGDITCNSLTTGNITAGSISTTAALNCGALTCSSITNNSNAYDSLYRNNIKCYTVKGYSFNNTPTNVNNVFSVYPGNTTSNSSSLSSIVDDACWSISILYIYYTTYSSNTNLYQGSTKFMIMKYGNGSWITMTVSLSGSSNYQPASFSISEGVLTISHAQAAITDLTVYIFYEIEMY